MKDNKDLRSSDSSPKETKGSNSLFTDPILQKQVNLFNNLSANQKRWVFYSIVGMFVFPSFIWLGLIALIFIYTSFKDKKSSETDIVKPVNPSVKHQSNNTDVVKKDIIKTGGVYSVDGYGKQESKHSAVIWVVLLIAFFVAWLFLNSR